MKVAIIQEWLVSIGGSDKVVKAIFDLFPNAEIYTLVANKDVCNDLGIPWNKVHTSFIQDLPFAKTKYRNYLPLFPFAIEQFDLRGYDIIISSSHAVAKGVLTKCDQLHICYCHSPIRYVWDMYNEYLEESHLNKGMKSWIVRCLLHKIRQWDLASSFRVDYFVSNSNYVARRIKETYRRNATTIYPNIDIEHFHLCTQKHDFYLACSRLVGYKKMDLIVMAFSQMPDKKLIVIGSGPQLKALQKIATPNVTVMGFQPFNVLRQKMEQAKALIFAADEDFGMIPIEAQACGTPVIAYGHGGSLETVVDGETGLFFKRQDVSSIVDAIKKFETNTNLFDSFKIRKHAELFSEERFKKEFKEFVLLKYKEFNVK